jgi:hypothetical protein
VTFTIQAVVTACPSTFWEGQVAICSMPQNATEQRGQCGEHGQCVCEGAYAKPMEDVFSGECSGHSDGVSISFMRFYILWDAHRSFAGDCLHLLFAGLGFEDCSASVQPVNSTELAVGHPYTADEQWVWPDHWRFYQFDVADDDFEVVVNVATEDMSKGAIGLGQV